MMWMCGSYQMQQCVSPTQTPPASLTYPFIHPNFNSGLAIGSSCSSYLKSLKRADTRLALQLDSQKVRFGVKALQRAWSSSTCSFFAWFSLRSAPFLWPRQNQLIDFGAQPKVFCCFSMGFSLLLHLENGWIWYHMVSNDRIQHEYEEHRWHITSLAWSRSTSFFQSSATAALATFAMDSLLKPHSIFNMVFQNKA